MGINACGTSHPRYIIIVASARRTGLVRHIRNSAARQETCLHMSSLPVPCPACNRLISKAREAHRRGHANVPRPTPGHRWEPVGMRNRPTVETPYVESISCLSFKILSSCGCSCGEGQRQRPAKVFPAITFGRGKGRRINSYSWRDRLHM